MPIVSTGQITIVDVNDGLDAGLSANGVVLAADASGTVASFATAETTLTIREAGVVSTAGWTIYVSATGGGISYRDSDDAVDRTDTGAVNGLLTGTPGYVKVVALTQDLSHLDITAVKGTQTVVRRFSVAKARAGAGGSPGTRGTITTAAATTGTSWVDSEATAAISAAGGGSPLQGDVVTLYNTGASFSQTRVRSSGGTWSPLTAFFGGNVIVDNTLAASKIVAGSIWSDRIAAGAIRADHILVAPKGLNPDPLFEAGASFWGGFVEQRAASHSSVPSGCPGRLATKFNSRDNMGPWLDVNPGEVYKVSIWVNREGATANAGWVSYSLNALGQDQLIYWAGSTSSSGWQLVVTTFTVSSNVRRMRFGAWIDYPGGGAQYIWATDFQIEKVNDASLIVDGTISAAKISAGAITTDKLLVAGRGAALNDDPGCRDQSAWSGWNGNPVATVTSISNGRVGNSVLRSTGGSRSISSKLIPADPGKTYRLSAWVRQVGNGLLYLRTVDYGPSETSVSGGIERAYSGLEAVSPPSNMWTWYSTQFTVPAGRAFVVPHILLAWNGTTGYMEAQDVRIEEAVSADLIVNGAISANKLAANSIAVGTAAIEDGAITTFMLGNGTITNAKITSMSADKLTAGTMQVGSFIQSDSYESSSGTAGWRINADGTATFNNVLARGNINATSGSIIGATIATAASGQRIVLDSQGLLFLTGASSGKYGSFKYGAKKYGSGVLVYFNNATKRVPFYVSGEQNVADIHLYNRSANPTGATYEDGDMIVVNGRLRIYVTALGGWKQVALE